MSNPFKAIGKVFKKVFKVVKKIAIPLLMVGAVVLTAGAAIPALGAALGMTGGIGGVLAGIGIKGALGSVLSSAISMGAIGAVTGGITGGWKGAKAGFLMGAATGGIMGAIAPGMAPFTGAGRAAASGAAAIGPGGIPATPAMTGGVGFNAAGQWVGTGAQAAGGSLIGTTMPTIQPFNMLGNIPGAISETGSLGQSLIKGAVGAGGGGGGGGLFGSGGLLGSAPQLLQLGGQVLSGFSQGKMAEAEMKARVQQEKDYYDRTAMNYGYRNIYGNKKSNLPTAQQQMYQYAPQLLEQPQSLLQVGGGQTPSMMYQIIGGKVQAVPA